MLPVLRPVGGEEEVNAIRESIESGWWGKGPKVAQFEKEFAELVGAKYAVAINSATSGQDLVLGQKYVLIDHLPVSILYACNFYLDKV